MIRSMTAFARVTVPTEGATLIWELKSVNHRYLEVSPRLPEAFRDLEGPVREVARKRLGRGKVEISFRYQLADDSGKLSLNEALVQELADAARRVGDIVMHPSPVDVTEILRYPGVLQSAEVDGAALRKAALQALDQAIDVLLENRAREGEALEGMIEERLEGVLAQVEIARKAIPRILDSQRDKLRKRVEEVLESADPQRLEQEIVMLAQKMDIAEEMDRLTAHVDEVRHALAAGGSCGRRLDFLMQEFNREANTLGSKSVDTETTQAAVELKVLIEQMREQVQNIE